MANLTVVNSTMVNSTMINSTMVNFTMANSSLANSSLANSSLANSTMTISPESFPTIPSAIILPIFAFFAILLAYTPFRLLCRVQNIAGATLVVTMCIPNLEIIINAALWSNDNVATWYPGYGVCDIQAYIHQPLYCLLCSCTCCITRFLAGACDTENARLFESRSMKRRRMVKDCLFIFVIPAVMLPLQYLIISNRYNITTVYGCLEEFHRSWPRVVIVSIWPVLYALVNLYYAALVVLRLRKHRNQLSKTLSSTGSGLSPRRFMKLVILSSAFLLLFTPIILYTFYLNLPSPYLPYSFSSIHAPDTFNVIYFWPTSYVGGGTLYNTEWESIAFAFVVWLTFGLNTEGIEMYRKVLLFLGFATCFPGLHTTPEMRALDRRASAERRGSDGESSGKLLNRFDLVGKALTYFDRSGRKNSRVTSTSFAGTDGQDSRKGSLVPLEFSETKNRESSLSSTTLASSVCSPYRKGSAGLADGGIPEDVSEEYTISPVAVGFQPVVYRADQAESSTRAREVRNGFFSTFRTHLHPSLPLFSPTRSPSPSTDLPVTSFHTDQVSTTRTTVWADAQLADIDREETSTQPKLGSRAYRERERRELEMSKEAQDRNAVQVQTTVNMVIEGAPRV